MFWTTLYSFFRRWNIRLILIITLAAATASLIFYGLLLVSLALDFGKQDRMELESRLLSYWAAWQYGGDDAVLEQASADMREHGGRPFLLRLEDPNGALYGALVPGGWEHFDLSSLALDTLQPGAYIKLRDEALGYSLLVTGADMDDGSKLLVGLSTENREFLLRMYQKNYPLALGGVILVGIIVGLFAARRLLIPIVGLNREIDRIIVTGELHRRLESPGTGDQLDGLIGRYNRLLGRMESLIAGMRETLDAVAHDLRTPLTRLRGHAELALKKGDFTEYEDALAMVVEQTDQAGALLSALMDISEAEQGMLRLGADYCNLSALVAEVVDMYRFIAEEKNQELKLHVSGVLSMVGDPVRLRQVFGNLIDNAVKYGPPSGTVDVYCEVGKAFHSITVVDDGPGVPEKDLPRVFDRLYRGDRSRASRGLGLGLSMVKALVESHGGAVGVDRAPGRGARFRVLLPAHMSKK